MRGIAFVMLCSTLLAVAACAPPSSSSKAQGSFGAKAREAASDKACSIAGTTVDAATGEALAGVSITGPKGARATSDKSGRFVIADLPAGTTGEVEAVAKDGRKARVSLRPLAAGTLEIVLHLK